jgi:hypothetical protein
MDGRAGQVTGLGGVGFYSVLWKKRRECFKVLLLLLLDAYGGTGVHGELPNMRLKLREEKQWASLCCRIYFG